MSILRIRKPLPAITDNLIAAAMWGRTAEYVHGVSVHGAVDLSRINDTDHEHAARIALAEITAFAGVFGTELEAADRINCAQPNPRLRTGPGPTLLSAATVVLVHVGHAKNEHPDAVTDSLRANRIRDLARDVIAARTYLPLPNDGETVPYRIGDAAADLLHHLVRLAVEDAPPRRAPRMEMHDLLHLQFQRLGHPTPRAAWLPI